MMTTERDIIDAAKAAAEAYDYRLAEEILARRGHNASPLCPSCAVNAPTTEV